MLKIRLRRGGSTHAPHYRIVVSDSRRTPRASNVETIGTYDPTVTPTHFEIDRARVEHWVGNGAQLSPTIAKLLKKHDGEAAAAPAEAAAE